MKEGIYLTIEEFKELNERDHKTLSMEQRAKIICTVENNCKISHREYMLNMFKKQNREIPEKYKKPLELLTPEFLLSDKLNKEYYIFYQLHFENYYCPNCNKKFSKMWEISDDFGIPCCMRELEGKDEHGFQKQCWTHPKELPK